VGKPEGKRPLARPRRRWEDVIRMDLREIGWWVWSGFSWLIIGTGRRSHVNTVMDIRVLAPRSYIVNSCYVLFSLCVYIYKINTQLRDNIRQHLFSNAIWLLSEGTLIE
jgi:hypothetical protein